MILDRRLGEMIFDRRLGEMIFDRRLGEMLVSYDFFVCCSISLVIKLKVIPV